MIHSEIRTYLPAITLDAYVSRRMRRYLLRAIFVAVCLLEIALTAYIIGTFVQTGEFNTSTLLTDMKIPASIFCILLGVFLFLVQITFFYNSFYYRGISTVYGENFADGEGVTYEVAELCASHEKDLTRGFLASRYGREIMIRAGIVSVDIDLFINSPRTAIPCTAIPLTKNTFTDLTGVGTFVYTSDSAFATFLFKRGVTEELFMGALTWVARVRLEYKRRQRWWSRDALGEIRSLGRELSYGGAYALHRYERDIRTTSALSLMYQNTAYAHEIIEKIETTLTRSKSANVMLIGDPGVGTMDILIEFGRRIRDGHSRASLSAKRLVVFDTDVFVAAHNSKSDFEYAFLELMSEAERAGNIIIVIENITSFLASVSALSIDAGDLLDRFLVSREVQIIATADPQSFHASLESKQHLLQYFENVHIETPDIFSSVRVLEEAARSVEQKHSLYFTYPALVRVAEGAEQYIVEGVMPDKALSLLALVASRAEDEGMEIVEATFVDTCLTEKTGIPLGPVGKSEREMLMHLEDILHERVVGQHEAIRVIANAMRRARAGIQSKEKPIGTFLFLGSTGVGKTETAKALAYTFFGSEERMVRFDMSEYSGEESVVRLIGNAESAGALTSALREHPYSVLLLDEFEKASEAVRDLFLQIFDEGRFTDGRGGKVNARNTIIIATSNAGSDLMWKYAQEGKSLEQEKDAIINAIIERRTYRPELLNRFDAIVLFEILKREDQHAIAKLMLTELAGRIKKRGYELAVSDAVISALLKDGYDPEFGARALRRIIQDTVEEKIARKILEKELHAGDTIELTLEDIQ